MASAEKPVTFEVTVPAADSAVGFAALQRLAQGYDGWRVQQKAPAEATPVGDASEDLSLQSQPVYLGDFQDISLELWQTEIYGDAAFQHVDALRTEARGGLVSSDGIVNMKTAASLGHIKLDDYPFCSVFKEDGKPNPEIAVFRQERHRLPDEILQARAEVLWNRGGYPFAMLISTKTHNNGTRTMELQPGDMMKDRLAYYMRGNELTDHTLHGTLGKMLDTINIVAGAVNKNDIGERDIVREFISQEELDGLMKAELRQQNASRLHSRISELISGQLVSGRPYYRGEVIVEGAFTKGQYEKIALCSLAAVAESFTPGIPANQFLINLVNRRSGSNPQIV